MRLVLHVSLVDFPFPLFQLLFSPEVQFLCLYFFFFERRSSHKFPATTHPSYVQACYGDLIIAGHFFFFFYWGPQIVTVYSVFVYVKAFSLLMFSFSNAGMLEIFYFIIILLFYILFYFSLKHCYCLSSLFQVHRGK